MNSVVVISCLLAASVSAGILAGVPHVTTTQYHSQDDLGQYSYGYSGGPSAKEETRTADGVTRGSYSYIDANGILQSASYVADPVNGFRVAATNLPQPPPPISTPVVAAAPPGLSALPAVVASPGFDHVRGVPLETPEVGMNSSKPYDDRLLTMYNMGALLQVEAAKAAHFAAHNEALARLSRRWKRSPAAPTGQSYSVVTPSGSTTVVSGPFPRRSFSYSTVASAPLPSPAPALVTYSAPASTVVPGPAGSSFSYSAIGTAPLITTYSATPVSSRYQSQDDLGQYSYGYSDGLSSKSESRTADGVTHGRYSYLDSNGIVQSVKYVADAGGFRVAASNLPMGP